MKKAKIALSVIAAFTVVGSVLAFKAAKRTYIVYFTTTRYSYTATKTLTMAITVVPDPELGSYRYYTLLDNARAIWHSYVTKGL